RQGAASGGGGSRDGRCLRREPSRPGLRPLRRERRVRWRGRRLHRADLDARAGADLGLAGRRDRGRDHRRPRQSDRSAARRTPDRCHRIRHDGDRHARMGSARLVFRPDLSADPEAGSRVSDRRRSVVALILTLGLSASMLPAFGLPAFYESFLYLVFSWIALATSWSILSGYAGYFSFGHGPFFGAGRYTTATLAGVVPVAQPWGRPAARAL